jgi:branched-chain amino acid transport system substrate-binding protein
LFAEITPGGVDYGPLVAELSSIGADVVYYGGYAREAGLIIRQARNAGNDLQLVVGDGVASGDFWLVAGPAGEGTWLTAGPDPRNDPAATTIVGRFRDSGYEPEGFTLYAYAAIQAWAQAVEQAGTLDYEAVIEALHAHEFDTVLGRIRFDDKGDVRGFEPFVWYVWRDGDYAPAVDPGD